MLLSNVSCQSEHLRNLQSISQPPTYRISIKDGKTTIHSTSLPCIIHRSETAFAIYPFRHQFVGNRLNSEEFEELLPYPQNPVFVDAQTGCGKTQMIFHELFPPLKKRGKRLLVFMSRSALKQQTKHDAMEADAPEFKEELTEIGITKHHIFGDIEVYSYQDLDIPKNVQEILNNIKSGYYGAVVFDECHYFIADADFNTRTKKQFDFLLDTFIYHNVFRIYLTATPDYVFDKIYKKEYDYNRFQVSYTNYSFTFHHFYFKRDYSYLNIRFFPMEKLPDIIMNNKSGKFLIFTESKEFANQKIEELKDKGIESVFLFDSDSSHDTNSEEANKVRKGLLDNDVNVNVLFATKCLDAGVTINTKGLNLVCCLKDKVDFIQAVGRKRIKGKEEVKLYIPIYSEKDINNYRGRLERTLYHMYKAIDDFPDGILMNASSYPPSPVYVENGRYQHNDFAFKKIQDQLWDINFLKCKIASSEDKPEITIAKHILSWINLEGTFSMDMILRFEDSNSGKIDNAREAILQIIQQYSARDLNSEEFQELQEKLKCYDPRKDTRKDRDALSTQTMNSIFSEHSLDYKIKKKGDLYRIYSTIESQ